VRTELVHGSVFHTHCHHTVAFTVVHKKISCEVLHEKNNTNKQCEEASLKKRNGKGQTEAQPSAASPYVHYLNEKDGIVLQSLSVQGVQHSMSGTIGSRSAAISLSSSSEFQ
jgi:hypothetical protein